MLICGSSKASVFTNLYLGCIDATEVVFAKLFCERTFLKRFM